MSLERSDAIQDRDQREVERCAFLWWKRAFLRPEIRNNFGSHQIILPKICRFALHLRGTLLAVLGDCNAPHWGVEKRDFWWVDYIVFDQALMSFYVSH